MEIGDGNERTSFGAADASVWREGVCGKNKRHSFIRNVQEGGEIQRRRLCRYGNLAPAGKTRALARAR